MSDVALASADGYGLSEIASEFKELDSKRRRQGLSLTEANHYYSLYERLSEILASGERHRRVDTRQFLRIPFDMELIVRTPNGEFHGQCHDFGGGGCSISTSEIFAPNSDVWIDGAIVAGEHYPLHGRAQVSWSWQVSDVLTGYGLRFAIDSPPERDQIDRIFYRALDRFLNSSFAAQSKSSPAPLRALRAS